MNLNVLMFNFDSRIKQESLRITHAIFFKLMLWRANSFTSDLKFSIINGCKVTYILKVRLVFNFYNSGIICFHNSVEINEKKGDAESEHIEISIIFLNIIFPNLN